MNAMMKLENEEPGSKPKKRGEPVSEHFEMSNPGSTTPTGDPVKPKLYNGLDLDELISKIQKFCAGYGEEVHYQSSGWGGVGTITFTPAEKLLPSHNEVTSFLDDTFSFFAKYKVHVSYSGITNFTDDEPFFQVTFKVPGKRFEDEKHG